MNFKRGWKGRLEGAMKAIHEKEEKEEKEEKGKNEKVVDDAEVKRLLKKVWPQTHPTLIWPQNLTEEGKFRYSIRSKLPSRMAEDEKEIALEKIVAQVISNWEQKEDPKQRKKMKWTKPNTRIRPEQPMNKPSKHADNLLTSEYILSSIL